MSDTQQQLDGFYQFASQQIVLGPAGRSLSDLFDEWQTQQVSQQELEENALAVRASLRDIERGEMGRPFELFAQEFRLRNNIAGDA